MSLDYPSMLQRAILQHLCIVNQDKQIPKKMEQKQLIPPFSAESAAEKLQLNENVWNTRDVEKIGLFIY